MGRTIDHYFVQLDVYYPPDVPEALTAPPVLVFFYGGGFTRGSRSSGPSYLVHNNLGAFFASRGILTVIPDYRLDPTIKFPEGSEDVKDAVEWVVKNFPASSSNTFIMGHSAGGVHIAGVLFTPELFSHIYHAIRGVVLIGVPMTIPASRPDFYAAAINYYGSPKAINRNHPLGLLQRCGKEIGSTLPSIRALRASSEPRYISTSMHTFAENFRKKGGVIEEFVLEGHDHLSPVLALCSGSGEEWGLDIVKWIQDITQGSRIQP